MHASRRRRERGSALVVVVVVILVTITLTAAYVGTSVAVARGTGAAEARCQARLAALSGLHRALVELDDSCAAAAVCSHVAAGGPSPCFGNVDGHVEVLAVHDPVATPRGVRNRFLATDRDWLDLDRAATGPDGWIDFRDQTPSQPAVALSGRIGSGFYTVRTRPEGAPVTGDGTPSFSAAYRVRAYGTASSEVTGVEALVLRETTRPFQGAVAIASQAPRPVPGADVPPPAPDAYPAGDVTNAQAFVQPRVAIGALALGSGDAVTFAPPPGGLQEVWLQAAHVTAGARVVVRQPSSPSACGVLRIYLAGPGPFRFSGNGISNDDPRSAPWNLQLVSDRPASIVLSGGSFTGVVYAPEAALDLSGTGEGASVGAVVAASVTLGPGSLRFDGTLASRAFRTRPIYRIATLVDVVAR